MTNYHYSSRQGDKTFHVYYEGLKDLNDKSVIDNVSFHIMKVVLENLEGCTALDKEVSIISVDDEVNISTIFTYKDEIYMYLIDEKDLLRTSTKGVLCKYGCSGNFKRCNTIFEAVSIMENG